MTNELKETISNQPIQRDAFRKALQVWFSPADLLDLATLVLAAGEHLAFGQYLVREYGITSSRYSDLVLKMKKEVERV